MVCEPKPFICERFKRVIVTEFVIFGYRQFRLHIILVYLGSYMRYGYIDPIYCGLYLAHELHTLVYMLLCLSRHIYHKTSERSHLMTPAYLEGFYDLFVPY